MRAPNPADGVARSGRKPPGSSPRLEEKANKPGSEKRPGDVENTRGRSVAIFVETERGRRRGADPYSCTVTTPGDGISKVSAKSPTPLWRLGTSRRLSVPSSQPSSSPA